MTEINQQEFKNFFLDIKLFLYLHFLEMQREEEMLRKYAQTQANFYQHMRELEDTLVRSMLRNFQNYNPLVYETLDF